MHVILFWTDPSFNSLVGPLLANIPLRIEAVHTHTHTHTLMAHGYIRDPVCVDRWINSAFNENAFLDQTLHIVS